MAGSRLSVCLWISAQVLVSGQGDVGPRVAHELLPNKTEQSTAASHRRREQWGLLSGPFECPYRLLGVQAGCCPHITQLCTKTDRASFPRPFSRPPEPSIWTAVLGGWGGRSGPCSVLRPQVLPVTSRNWQWCESWKSRQARGMPVA